MQYDFKFKWNKVDSQGNRNLLIPEIDWVLNEAQELIVKWIAEPRLKTALGFESNQRNTDDIRTLVVSNRELEVVENVSTLPNDYWYHVKSHLLISNEKCKNKRAELKLRQHDDDFENSFFGASSFKWRTVNGLFFEKGVKFFTDGEFTVDKFVLSYIKKLRYIHNAESFSPDGYNLPSGVSLTGSVDCELPESMHREIVDIAVALVSGQILSPGFEYRMAKLNFNNLK